MNVKITVRFLTHFKEINGGIIKMSRKSLPKVLYQ